MTVLFVRQNGQSNWLTENGFNVIADNQLSNVGSEMILWRWGSFAEFPSDRRQVNTREACVLAANKPAVRKLCEANHIRIPVTYYDREAAGTHFSKQPPMTAPPLLWRPRSHEAGQNMVVVRTADEVTQEHGYWSQIIAKTDELRVYVLFGRVIGVDRKVVEDPTQLAWNHAAGGKFRVLHWDQWPSAACWMSTKLAHAMGLHFGAFDLIKGDHQFFMLEVNTNPTMITEYKTVLLQRAVAWLESITTENVNLPPIATPLPEMVKGYRHYIHALHNVRERGS